MPVRWQDELELDWSQEAELPEASTDSMVKK